ncbi:isoleucine--tRNA ligase [Polyangium spumosum]|uniref:Isoleucine--tRNA ligase n=1 Tax=Polyangium spumosum TaxID=889282 RepID=A0A6N7PSQ8_9BACT|nr:isoleucine--tRNA ligase [Polyangium spumosum]MRG93285.1 isoleucine--tRNA ligase [Polyangium spumosum]
MSGRESSPKNLFKTVRPELDFPRDEAEILAFWKREGIFQKTLSAETRATGPSKGTFVFYEGPPTANGMPHNGHVLTRAVKDVFPRYKTMRGYDVPRKAGWDTHGLPVEVEVEKELRIHGKADIEKYGVEPFVARCIESVFRYTDAWEKLTDKIGFWVDLPDAYVTYHRSYVESVWWALAKLYEKGLLYQGHKVVWWWAQGGTALSSAEVGQGYKTVDDPSVFVAFPLVDEPGTALCVWTTTPWTLPSNMYAAVRADFDYVVVDAGDRKLIVAAGLREALAKKLGKDLPVLSTTKGSALVGKKYVPPFDLYAAEAKAYEAVHAVVAADFVTLDAGTGIVHIAPAFGEDDYGAHRQLLAAGKTRKDPFCAVKPDGTFVDEMGKYAGRWVKDSDKDLQKDLAQSGKLVFAELYRHEYPFCWRADDDPLIQYARPAWYIRTTALIHKAIENNQTVNWLPEHIKTGRFGDFLANNVDWALSRERYWGTPLPIWVNDQTGAMEAIDSVTTLRAKAGNNVAEVEAELKNAHPKTAEHLLVHKPWIDKITYQKPGEPGTYRRVSEVIDCWFDSGAMPFAQWGFPHAEGSKEKFDRAFPADFISEAIDQTRGWFYSLLMISTLVFDEQTQKSLGLSRIRSYPHPYQTCVVLGHVGDREGKKESKSKGNYTPPEVILDRVRMEFAVSTGEKAHIGVVPEGVGYIAREDYEGLDLSGESAKVKLYRGDRPGDVMTLELRPATGKLRLPRRILALSGADLAKLGLVPGENPLDVKPNEVFRQPQEARAYIEDPSAPAPGADAFRWFFYASSPPWTNTRHSLTNVRATQKEYAIKIRNVWSFFSIYANIDGFDPARGNGDAKGVTPADLAKSEGYRPARERSLLDRWLLSELALTTREVTQHLDDYRLYEAAQRLVDFVDALSNWYVRRSRARYWSPAENVAAVALADKRDAYFTLYEALVVIAHLTAPFTPFLAEELYQALVRGPWKTSQPESVHLARFPEPDLAAIDEGLAAEMRAVRELVSLGLQVRTLNKLKVRQPLARADVIVSNQAMRRAIAEHAALIAEELNVKEVRFLEPGQEGEAVRYVLKPNFRALGPKLGKKVQLAKQVLAKANAAELRTELVTRGAIELELDGEKVSLGPEEIEVVVEAGKDFAAAGGKAGVVVLHAALTDALRDEGLAREILSRVQGLRKDLSLGFTDRITLAVEGSERVLRVTRAAQDDITREALVRSFEIGSSTVAGERRELNVDGEALVLTITRA